MTNSNMQPAENSSQTGSGSFIQPYTGSQTAAKDLILAKKGIASSDKGADPYTLNLFTTLYSQERHGGGGAGSNVSNDIQGILDQIKSEQEVQGILNQIKSEQTQKAIDNIKQDVERIYGSNRP